MILRVAEVNPAQFRRVGVVPSIILGWRNRMRPLKAAGQRLYEPILKLGRAMGKRPRFLEMLVRDFGTGISLLLAHFAPREIIERTRPIGDAPVGHHAFRVKFHCFFEALLSFSKIEAE